MAATELNAGENLQFEFNLLTMEDGLDFKGVWSALTAYVIDDVVTNDGVAYKSILGGTNFEPPNGTYWEVLPPIDADDVKEIIAQLQEMDTDVSAVQWKYRKGQPSPSNLKLSDGLLQIELLKTDSKNLLGHYDLVLELSTKSSLYVASGAQTDVVTTADVLNVSAGQAPPPEN